MSPPGQVPSSSQIQISQAEGPSPCCSPGRGPLPPPFLPPGCSAGLLAAVPLPALVVRVPLHAWLGWGLEACLPFPDAQAILGLWVSPALLRVFLESPLPQLHPR